MQAHLRNSSADIEFCVAERDLAIADPPNPRNRIAATALVSMAAVREGERWRRRSLAGKALHPMSWPAHPEAAMSQVDLAPTNTSLFMGLPGRGSVTTFGNVTGNGSSGRPRIGSQLCHEAKFSPFRFRSDWRSVCSRFSFGVSGMERRLAAILAIDVVGYSRLMEADEAGTFGKLRGRLNALVEPRIAEHNGRIFKLMGDGVLAEFASVIDAVECAAALQRAMAFNNDDTPDGNGIEARMAVHLGDVIVDGEDRQGEGVNIAARLEKLAEPGGLVISRAVHDQVRTKVPLRFEDLGDQQLRNIQEPVRVFRVAPGRPPGRADVLTVTTSPNFAAKWLVHRLGDFAESHPEIDLRIGASLHHVNFAREDVDVAIRHGEGHWPGLHVTRLAEEELFPVCSPALLRGRKPLREPRDLSQHTLLHLNDQRDWNAWFAAAGLGNVDGIRSVVFNQASMAIDAAIGGQGIALARTALAAWDLLNGRLARPFEVALGVPYAYWIVCPRANADLPKVSTFRHWLLDQAQADADALSRLFGVPVRT